MRQPTANYFAGLTEHADGVYVTGGNPTTVVTGISGSADGGISIFNNANTNSNITLAIPGEKT